MGARHGGIGVLLFAMLAACGADGAPQSPATSTTRLLLGEPFDIVEEPEGSYLVADRTADTVYRLSGTTFSTLVEVPGPRDLELLPNGDLLVASDRHVLSIERATGRTSTVVTARNDVLGISGGADGTIYLSEFGSRILSVRDGRSHVLASGLDGVHGLLATDLGLVVCESSTGRVLRIDADGTLEVLAKGLDLPSFAAAAQEGSLYVSEFGRGKIVRLSPSGAVTAVASLPSPTALSLGSDGRILAASLSGDVVSIDPETGRVEALP